MKKVILVVAILAVAAGAAVWYFRNGTQAVQYRTVKVEKGDLHVTVAATGTVQPVTQVQVGTQVTGVVQKLLADFNSRVKAGQVVANIDPAQFQARVDQDRASLKRAEADVGRVQAQLTQADKDLTRSRELAKRELISPSDLDAAVASRDSLVAQLKVAEAVVEQSRATLQISEVNLNYTTIICPINGVVVSRNVDVGQTVAASLQAPTIFVVAEDLEKIQVQASVAEADIGRIAVGQKTTFTVDAFRDLKFQGTVSQIRLAPTTVQNVVTYTVIVDAANPGEKLLPGMTANLSFEIEQHKAVLKIPNAALRFNPFPDAPREKPGHNRVWIVGPAGPYPVSVKVGATDGSFTVATEGVEEGQEVITGTVQPNGDGAVSNPFAPPRIRPGGRH